MPHKKIVPPTGSTFVNSNTVRPGVCNLGGHADEHCFIQNHKKTHATMGLPKDKTKIDMDRIQRLNATNAQMYHEAIVHDTRKLKTKPPVPKKNELPISGLTSGKNFIKNNKENNLSLKPPEQKQQMDYLKRKEFGQVPGYLDKVKQKVQEELEYIKKTEEEKNKKPERYVKLSSEEKEALKKNLILKYDEINREYQKITYKPPRIEDSIGLKKKRNYCETQLGLIEKYLNMLKKDEILVDMFE